MGHGIHEDAPAVGAYVWPATHGIGASEPAGQALPAGHVVRVPPEQYAPAGHVVHTAEPELGAYVPGLQRVGLVEEPGQALPTGHSIAPPPTGQYEPAGQAKHDPEDVLVYAIDELVFPAGQFVHEDAPVPEYEPAPQE